MKDADELFQDIEEESEGFYVDEYDIVTTPNDFNTMTIFSFMEDGSIELPIFQRNFTWDRKRASKLIESLMLGLPVPQIYLYEDSKNKYLILDGQQRLMSMYFFKKGRFPKPNKRTLVREQIILENKLSDTFLSNDDVFEDFSLKLPKDGTSRKSQFEGLKYLALGENKRSYDLRTVRMMFIKQNEPKDDNSSIYEIYDRLNTGGVNLRPQEIRANLYSSEFYSSLYKMNKFKSWREILGQKEEDDYMRDVEIILRSIAMLVWAKEYRPSMTRFLNRFSNYAKKFISAQDIFTIEKIFEGFVSRAVSNKELFKNPSVGKFSIPIFESIFAALTESAWRERDSSKIIEIDQSKVRLLVNNKDFIDTLQEGTTKSSNLIERLSVAKQILV